MENKHTAGEWRATEKGILIISENYPIAHVFDNKYGNTPQEAEANAKLIVAAPELLEVLKQFLHSVEHEGVIEGRVVDAVRNAKEIISKATN